MSKKLGNTTKYGCGIKFSSNFCNVYATIDENGVRIRETLQLGYSNSCPNDFLFLPLSRANHLPEVIIGGITLLMAQLIADAYSGGLASIMTVPQYGPCTKLNSIAYT